MKLSAEERRLLSEIERRIASQDPDFAASFNGSPRPVNRGERRRVLFGAICFLLGLAALVAATAINVAFAGAGAFVLMVAGAVTAVEATTWRPRLPQRPPWR